MPEEVNSKEMGALHRFLFFFLKDTAPTEIYPLPLHAALPILGIGVTGARALVGALFVCFSAANGAGPAQHAAISAFAEAASRLYRGGRDLPVYADQPAVATQIGRAHV